MEKSSLDPFTSNGFLGGRNDTIIPEWKVTDYKNTTIQDGAEMYKVINGKEELLQYLGMYNYKEMLRTIAEDLEKIADSYKETDENLKKSLMK